MTRVLGGIFAPVVTTFDHATGAVALGPFESNIRAHLDAGLAGVVLAGSTGEAPLLDDDERVRLLESARRAVPSDRWLIAGVGSESTRLTVRRARDAKTAGADAVLVVAPHYYTAAMTGEVQLAHYRRVADESPLPVLLYNIPKYMHFAIPADVVAQLATHGNVIGIKDSSGDMTILRGYLASQSATFTVLTGNGQTWSEALIAGVRGGILAVALFAPELSLEVEAAVARGDAHAAQQAQARLTAPAREIVGALGIPGVKAALDIARLVGGPVRSPLMPLDAAGVARVAALLRGMEPAGVA
jgi:4-hydroxy-2-oxoglutarate aldolase